MAVSSSLKTPLTSQGLRRYFPFLDWLLHYRRADLPNDLVAGLVTAIMLIPQSMAYAQLAGLPPQVGLYASVAPLAVYALLGTSGQLSVGPVAITSLAVFAGVSALAEPGSPRYMELVLLLAFIVGLVKLLLGVLRLGCDELCIASGAGGVYLRFGVDHRRRATEVPARLPDRRRTGSRDRPERDCRCEPDEPGNPSGRRN